MTQKDERTERFIGRFTVIDAKTGQPTGDDGYVALLLTGEDRVPQVILATTATLDELVSLLKSEGVTPVNRGRIAFEPPKPFYYHGPHLSAVPEALTLEEIGRVQIAFGKY